MATTTSTDEPLRRALPALMRQRGLTYRALAARTREHAGAANGVTSGHLANLVSGRNRASAPVLELIAKAGMSAPLARVAPARTTASPGRRPIRWRPRFASVPDVQAPPRSYLGRSAN